MEKAIIRNRYNRIRHPASRKDGDYTGFGYRGLNHIVIGKNIKIILKYMYSY